mgnify:CR=1 FL=1
MSQNERKYLLDAFDSNWIAPLGPHVDGFENEMAEYLGVKHAATSRPVITTDAPGCRDALIDGETGYLVRVKDSVDLINKISSLLNDQKRRVTMGQAGRKLVAAKFSEKRIVRDTLKVYEDLLSLNI